MDAIRETFFQECEEQLAALELGLLAMQAGDGDGETVNAVFRAVHSVKGGAGAFGLEPLVRFAHVFETALDDMRGGRLVATGAIVNLMLRAADVVADLVRAARDGGPVNTERNGVLADELRALGARPAAADAPGGHVAEVESDDFDFQPVAFEFDFAPAADPAWVIKFRPRAELYGKGNESAVLMRELRRLGTVAVEADLSALPAFAALDAEASYLAWTVRLTTGQPEAAIREVFEFVEDDCDLDIRLAVAALEPVADGEALLAWPEDDLDLVGHEASAPVADARHPAPATAVARATPPAEGATAPAAAKATIRVDLERVDQLIDLVGELVINQAMLSQRVLEAGLARSSNVALGLGELEQLTRQMQESVMAIRAQPVKAVFQRMPRLVRELAAVTGKQVRLVTEGEATEVDKTVIEHLSDPLTHMIRNAIDHGLERPEEREAAGKPAEGVVRLAARHRSGRIIIEVGDDGAGINRARVRASAVAKGLVPSEAVLSDEETDNLIFLPGFSTAETISDISGRGVGMDVVRRSIQALGGRIVIASRPGRGSTFTLSLPLTLAVLDGMVVSVANQTLVIPLTTIIETLQPRAAEVHGLGGGAMVVAIRGSYIPLLDVGVALGYRDQPVEPATGVTLLIEGEGGVRAALLVDAIQGQYQVVIKSLEANYRRVPGIAAATILGDGQVALIIDVDAVVIASRNGQARAAPVLELAA